MNSVTKMLTSALVISGAAAAITLPEVDAAELEHLSMTEDDLTDLTDLDVLEDALRHFVNPLNQVHHYLEHYQAEDYIIYEVKEGDTISEISVRFGIPEEEIVRENQIRNKHRIAVGQQLQIRLKERNHFVRLGESLADIADAHGISLEELISYNEELVNRGLVTYPGQQLKIPTLAPEPIYQPLSPSRKSRVLIASRSELTYREISGMTWPLSGTIMLTSSFGPRWGRMHNGIDITNQKKSKAPILAAQDGIVLEAYYNRGGYGNLIILDHGQGIHTYYAHLSSIEVKEGQAVKQGETIGYMGNTGHSTGYHLHFEIRKENKPINPLHYLPKEPVLR